MEPIPLRAVLGTDLDPALCKLHCAVFDGERHPSHVLTGSWDEWVGWNTWRGTTDFFNRQFIFSLAQSTSDGSLWLFGGVFEVIGRRPTAHAHSYDVRLRTDLLGSFIKRLRVRFHAPRNTRLNFDKQIDLMSVHSVLAEPYAGDPFPGHDRINHTFADLQVLTLQNRPDWQIALQHMKGVYVIHDQVTGQPYVGSAYGDTGIWQRMTQYAETLHGNNVGLIELVEREGPDYARNNLRFALLEYWSMRTEDQHVLDREAYWKGVLLSRSLGINRN